MTGHPLDCRTSTKARPLTTAADLSATTASAEVLAVYEALWQPGTGTLHAARDLEQVDNEIWFTGATMSAGLMAGPVTVACRLDASGRLHTRHGGTRLARTSRTLRATAHVRSRAGRDDAVDIESHLDESVPDSWSAPGIVEQLRWSPDGRQLLLLVAGRQADVAGRDGGFAMNGEAARAAWLPEVHGPSGEDRWRSLWIWTPGNGTPHRITHAPCNPWEAAWSGSTAVVAVVSGDHGEDSWYGSTLVRIDTDGGNRTTLRTPSDQIGGLACSPIGGTTAWIEAVASDRGLICGSLYVQHRDHAPMVVDTGGVDLVDLVWRDDHRILCTGVRGLETVVGHFDLTSGRFDELWCSADSTLSGWQPVAVPHGDAGALVVMESYESPPAIVMLGDGPPRTLLPLGAGRHPDLGSIRPVRWQADDGLEIEGLLIEPGGHLPRPAAGYPLLIDVHGGPIWAHRNRWAAGLRAAPALASKGYAVLLPNPRGSAGRGQDFARRVIGDMGGGDACDIIAGLDHLVALGIANQSRVAMSGSSYGGFLSAWLAARSTKLAAAVPISPITNWYTQRFGSQVSRFAESFLGASPLPSGGPYHRLSPIFHVRGMTTPTLVLAGGRDKNTPTSQAVEFYNAMVEAGACCELAVYPEGGHGLRGFPDYLDSAARIVSWLDTHLSP